MAANISHPTSSQCQVQSKRVPLHLPSAYFEQKIKPWTKVLTLLLLAKIGSHSQTQAIILARILGTFIGLGHLLIVKAKMVSTSPKPTQNEQLEWDNLPKEDEATIFRKGGNVLQVTNKKTQKHHRCQLQELWLDIYWSGLSVFILFPKSRKTYEASV